MTQITITGTDFTLGSSVLAGSLPCQVVGGTPPTELVCNTPAGQPIETVSITVSNGSGSFTLPDAFTYLGDPIAWFDAAAQTTLELDGGRVVRWNDRSKFGNDLPGCPGKLPDFAPSGLNGRPALDFPNNGASDCRCLSRSNAIAIPQDGSPRTLFTVASLEDTLGTRVLFGFGAGALMNNQRLSLYASTDQIGIELGTTVRLSDAGTIAAGVPFMVVYTYALNSNSDSPANEFRKSQVTLPMTGGLAMPLETMGSWLDIGRPPNATGGCGISHRGKISDVMLYNFALSSTERDVIEAYLKKKSGF